MNAVLQADAELTDSLLEISSKADGFKFQSPDVVPNEQCAPPGDDATGCYVCQSSLPASAYCCVNDAPCTSEPLVRVNSRLPLRWRPMSGTNCLGAASLFFGIWIYWDSHDGGLAARSRVTFEVQECSTLIRVVEDALDGSTSHPFLGDPSPHFDGFHTYLWDGDGCGCRLVRAANADFGGLNDPFVEIGADRIKLQEPVQDAPFYFVREGGHP